MVYRVSQVIRSLDSSAWTVVGRIYLDKGLTPTAKRNSDRVATFVGRLPRVASFARNPGLGKRNSYRVARGAHRPRWDKHTWL